MKIVDESTPPSASTSTSTPTELHSSQQLLPPNVQLQLSQHLKKRELEHQPDHPDSPASPRKEQRLHDLQEAQNGSGHGHGHDHDVEMNGGAHDSNEYEHQNGSHDEHGYESFDQISDSEKPHQSQSQSDPSKLRNTKAKKKLRRHKPQQYVPATGDTNTDLCESPNDGTKASNNYATTTSSNMAHHAKSHSTGHLPTIIGPISRFHRASVGTVDYNSITVTQVPVRELQKTFAETGTSLPFPLVIFPPPFSSPLLSPTS